MHMTQRTSVYRRAKKTRNAKVQTSSATRMEGEGSATSSQSLAITCILSNTALISDVSIVKKLISEMQFYNSKECNSAFICFRYGNLSSFILD